MSHGLVGEQLEKRGSDVEFTMKSKHCNIGGYQSKKPRSGDHRVNSYLFLKEIWKFGY